MNAVIPVAYQLLAKVDQETDAAEPLPKLVAVFTDRTMASWDTARVEDLKKLRDLVPDPKPLHVVFDFGVDAPANVGILSAEMKPQVIAANQAASITVSVGATGGDRPLDVTVQAKIDGAKQPESKAVAVPPGQTRSVTFEFRNLKPGLHQVEFSLAAADKLAADNLRFLTFKVGEARRILTITDDKKAAAFWQAAHMVKDEFSCLAVLPDEVEIGGVAGGATPDGALRPGCGEARSDGHRRHPRLRGGVLARREEPQRREPRTSGRRHPLGPPPALRPRRR